eukprot:812351-Rhodomonas_salina.1
MSVADEMEERVEVEEEELLMELQMERERELDRAELEGDEVEDIIAAASPDAMVQEEEFFEINQEEDGAESTGSVSGDEEMQAVEVEEKMELQPRENEANDVEEQKDKAESE